MPKPAAAGSDARAIGVLELLRWLGPLAALIVLGAAGYVLHDEFARLRLPDILVHLRSIPRAHVLAALALTAGSYCLISGYDVLALRYVRKRLHYGRVLFTSFIAAVFGHNLGFAAVTGGAIRLRLYTVAGITAVEVATITVFYSLSIALGLTCIAGLSLVFAPGAAAAALHLRTEWTRLAGAVLLGAVAAYVLWAGLSRRAIEIRGWALRAPGFALGGAQTLLSVLDLCVEGSVLWWLLPPAAHIGLVPFMGSYVIALSAGIISHVPGGIGVFETVMLLALHNAPADSVLGALLAFRAVYYLAPLLVGAALFAYQELTARRHDLARARDQAATQVTPVAPQIAGSLVFLAGALLVVAAMWPPVRVSLPWLRSALPPAVPIAAGLLASVLGVGLLLLSRALFRRVRSAYHLVFRLLSFAVLISLAQGLFVEETPLLALVLLVLWLGRDAFYRPTAILDERFTPVWITAIGGVILLAVWTGLLTERGTSHWWVIGAPGGGGPMLRTALLPALLVAGYLAVNLLRATPPEPAAASGVDLSRARRLIARGETSLANAVLSGDKRLLFADSGEAFLTYQVAGRSWVALGDPVGTRAEAEELPWRFCQIADRHGGQPVFYQTGPEWLSAYEDLGLAPLPLGAEARVPLAQFSLHGAQRAGLRHLVQHAHRAGLSFEVYPPPPPGPLFAELRTVSDAWLARHATGERRFSVGHFSPRYLRHFPLAVIRRGDNAVAFADLWQAGERAELALDLIRMHPDVPIGTMSYLLLETLLWARGHGYRWANLGLVPLEGLERGPLAPAWRRAGHLLFTHGEHFEHLEQMRPYFERFEPHWETRYLLARSDIALPRVLLDLARLIGGGVPR